MASNQKFSAKDCIHLANDIIIERNLLIPRLTSLQDINYSFFVLIFEDIFGMDFQELSSIEPKSKAQEIELLSQLLSYFSELLVAIPLDHIRAKDIVDKKLDSIHDLLEIILTFVQIIPKFNESKDKSFESQFDTKAVQTSRSSKESLSEEIRINDLIDSHRKQQKPLRFQSTSSSHSPESSSSESIVSDHQLRRSLRQLPVNVCIDSNKTDRKQKLSTKSKAIQTDTEKHLSIKPKTIVSPKADKGFEEYKRLKCENFATLLGHRLHETLKLKEMTDIIEYKIKRYYSDVTTKTPLKTPKSGTKSSQKLRSNKKQTIRLKRTQNKRNITPLKSKNNLFQSLDDLIKNFPEIPRNTIKSLKEQESRQKKILENLNKDVLVKEFKVKSRLNDAIETQEKRSKLIRNEIKHLETFAETKASKMAKIKENAEKRDSRIERSRMQKMVEKYQNDLNAKYKRLQSIEEQIVLNEYKKREKQQKDSINEMRNKIKDKQIQEMDKQKKMLNAFETLYQQKYEMLAQNLSEEEKRLKQEISSQSHYLRSLKREFNTKFENDFRNVFIS